MQHAPLKHQEKATRVTFYKTVTFKYLYCFFEKMEVIQILKLVLILFPHLPVLLLVTFWFNPLNAELNSICCLLALLGAHHFLHSTLAG